MPLTNGRKRRGFFAATAILACGALSLSGYAAAQESPAADTTQDQQGYPDEQQRPTGPTAAETDLANSFPQPGSVFRFGIPQSYFDWKERVYDDIGLQLTLSYQMLFMGATEVAPRAEFQAAFGQWVGYTAKYTPLNRGVDYEGSIVLVAGYRGSVGNNAIPAEYGQLDVGSVWPVNFEFTSWPIRIEELYWEQWIKKRVVIRAGVTAAAAAINPFRFKDARVSFTATPFAFHASIPAPAQGPGFAFKWWPIEDSEFYVTGVLNDVNGNPNDGWAGLDFGSFTKGEFFYGLEFGNVWRRSRSDFDQLYVTLFYVDERSTRSPDDLPNVPGGGFKILGSKQWGSWVGFGSYTLNNAEGGAVSVAFGHHTVTAGGAYLSPLGVRGEIGLGFIWMEPFQSLAEGTLRNQYGAEAYWRILLTPNFWLTPGIQYILHPSLNPTVHDLFIPLIKFRFAT